MSWFYAHEKIPSAINGTIECVRILGEWQIIVGGSGQSGPYLDTMWKQAVRRIPNPESVRKILVLGLGIGSSLRAYYRRFPKAHLTVVEIDPVMVGLMNRFGFLKKFPTPEILLGDAETIVPNLRGTFDLVVFDLFIGPAVAKATRGKDLLQAALQRLSRKGYLLLNAYKEPDLIDLFGTSCREIARWKYLQSHVALFRPWGAGTVGDPLPPAYRHMYSCQPFMQREFSPLRRTRAIGTAAAPGFLRALPGFDFLHFLGDTPPTERPPKTRARFTVWQPIRRTDVPEGWIRWPVSGHRRLTGFAQIPPGDEPYDLDWSEHAKRHLKRWKKQTAHAIRDADLDTYLAAFARCGKPKGLIARFREELRRKEQAHPGQLRLRVAEPIGGGAIIAGFATLWIPEIQQTFHVTSFITPEGRETAAAFGLVDDAFRIAQARGDRTLEFDAFYLPGDPRSWKGFTRFKEQFGVHYIRWPKPLARFD